MRVSSTVPGPARNMALADYLAARFTYLPRARWVALIEQEQVWVNEKAALPETPVSQGDKVTCDLPEPTRPPVNLDYTLLYEDRWLLAVNKPPGLRVHSSGKFVTANLIYHLRHEHTPPYPEASLVNRLDAGTSGVVLLARSQEAERVLSEQFASQTVVKEYLAVVHGHPDPPAGIIEYPVGTVPNTAVPHRQVVSGSPSALLSPDHLSARSLKPAVTLFETQQLLGKSHALLRLQPKTGRTHQLRVHLAAIGHPLLGDALYQMDDTAYLAWLAAQPDDSRRTFQGLARHALHAARLTILHPIHNKPLRVEAPLAGDLQLLIQNLSQLT